MIGSICISLIAFNQLKLVPRLLLDKLRLVASLKGLSRGSYYSFCTSTIYIGHVINCRFIHLLMIVICYCADRDINSTD